MTNIYTTTSLAIANYLQTNLTDPFLVSRTRWVYVEFQKDVPSYPIVVVRLLTPVGKEGGLGRRMDVGKGNIKEFNCNIHIIVKKDHVPTGNDKSNQKLIDSILDDVDYYMDVIMGNITNLRNIYQIGGSETISMEQTFERYVIYLLEMSNVIV